MRVINLDDTGIKIITSSKKQMYLSLSEVACFVSGKYTLEENVLSFNDKKLVLTNKDMCEFSNVLTYIERTVL